MNDPLNEGDYGSCVRELVESLGYFVRVYEVYEIQPWKSGECQVNYLLLFAGENGKEA